MPKDLVRMAQQMAELKSTRSQSSSFGHAHALLKESVEALTRGTSDDSFKVKLEKNIQTFMATDKTLMQFLATAETNQERSCEDLKRRLVRLRTAKSCTNEREIFSSEVFSAFSASWEPLALLPASLWRSSSSQSCRAKA